MCSRTWSSWRRVVDAAQVGAALAGARLDGGAARAGPRRGRGVGGRRRTAVGVDRLVSAVLARGLRRGAATAGGADVGVARVVLRLAARSGALLACPAEAAHAVAQAGPHHAGHHRLEACLRRRTALGLAGVDAVQVRAAARRALADRLAGPAGGRGRTARVGARGRADRRGAVLCVPGLGAAGAQDDDERGGEPDLRHVASFSSVWRRASRLPAGAAGEPAGTGAVSRGGGETAPGG